MSIGQQRSAARSVLTESADAPAAQSSELSARQANLLLAQISLVSGHLEQARTRYEGLMREAPGDPDPPAALGMIALRQGNLEEALKLWGQAVRNNLPDAELCFRYALMADDAGLDAQAVRAASERAVILKPDFDDARYKLALMQYHAGECIPAVAQLRALRVPTGERRYAYWTAMASALTDMDEREAAQAAAQEAVKAAQNDADRLKARQMEYMATTDLTVQFATDSQGHSQMVTTRIPHGTKDWNPFIEAFDRIKSTTGKLSQVFCAAGRLTGFLLNTANGSLTVEVPDPHVSIRNGSTEFFCGPIQEKTVEADFAVVSAPGKIRNVLRGMTFQ